LLDRSILTATPTPTRLRHTKGPEHRPPRYVFLALRSEDDTAVGFSALLPEAGVEPSDALCSRLAQVPTQYVYTTASPEAAVFFAETGSGPGFIGGYGLPRSPSKRQVAKVDLSMFKGEILDLSSIGGCQQHRLKKDSKSWEFAFDHGMVLLVGYVHPRLIAAVFDLEANPLPLNIATPLSARQNIPFDAFTASLPDNVRRKLASEWSGEAAGERMQCAPGHMMRDSQGLASDARSRASVVWDVKQRLDAELRKLEARRHHLSPHLEGVMEQELASCERAFRNAVKTGVIDKVEYSSVLVMRNWRCTEEFPYSTVTGIHSESEVVLRGTPYQTRLAMHGNAAIEVVHCAAQKAATDSAGHVCRHCMATQPAEFHLLRNVKNDGQSVLWPPYFRLFCFDPATEELDELLNTLGGTNLRDSEHPHVFPSDEVGFAFALERLPTALAGLEATLPREYVEDTDEVALPQRPLYLVLVVPEGVPDMYGETHDNIVAPLCVPPCRGLSVRVAAPESI
jgi:hypothetical protein